MVPEPTPDEPSADNSADDSGDDPTSDPFRGEDGDPVVPEGWTHGVVDANGIEFSYYRVGDRDDPTVVVAHGFFEDARCQQWLVDELAGQYDVVAYDARGHGHTDAPEDGYAPADRVADLLGVVHALDLDAPVLYGHSMGGGTVATAAAEHAERIRGVVMEDPAGLRWPPDLDLDELADDVREDVREDLSKSFPELLETYEEGDEAGVEELPPERYATFARSDQRMSEHLAEIPRTGYTELVDVFPEIDVPTLVLRRDADVDDRVYDHDVADELPDGRLVHVPDAGHHVVLTAPDAAFAEIRTFLRRITDGVDGTDSDDGGGD